MHTCLKKSLSSSHLPKKHNLTNSKLDNKNKNVLKCYKIALEEQQNDVTLLICAGIVLLQGHHKQSWQQYVKVVLKWSTSRLKLGQLRRTPGQISGVSIMFSIRRWWQRINCSPGAPTLSGWKDYWPWERALTPGTVARFWYCVAKKAPCKNTNTGKKQTKEKKTLNQKMAGALPWSFRLQGRQKQVQSPCAEHSTVPVCGPAVSWTGEKASWSKQWLRRPAAAHHAGIAAG